MLKSRNLSKYMLKSKLFNLENFNSENSFRLHYNKIKHKTVYSTYVRFERCDIDFHDAKTAYGNIDTMSLNRAYFVFKLCSCDILVKHQMKLLRWSRRVLGERVFEWLMNKTIHGQFMTSYRHVPAVSKKLATLGFLPMSGFIAKERHANMFNIGMQVDEEGVCQYNLDGCRENILLARQCTDGFRPEIRPRIALKVSGFTSPETLLDLNHLVRHNERILAESFLRARNDTTFKDEFTGILTEVYADAKKTYNMLPVHLPVSSDNPSLPLTLSFHLGAHKSRHFQHLTTGSVNFSSSIEEQVLRVWKHMSTLAQLTLESNVMMMWDAEQTYMQDALDLLILDQMRHFNKDWPAVQNTYQCYLKKSNSKLSSHLEAANMEGWCMGGKVVRGAYLDEERRLAEEQGYEDPINPSYDATTAMYYKCVETWLRDIARNPHRHCITVATHNEDTVKHVVNRLNDLGIEPHGNTIAFVQLYGMRDHISYTLATKGLPVAKHCHYGGVEDGIAYLSRRISENGSAMATANAERDLLFSEIKRRVLNKGIDKSSSDVIPQVNEIKVN